MKNQSESVLGNHKYLKLALIALVSVFILMTSAGIFYQFWFGTHLMAFALSFILVAESLFVCYFNAIQQMFKTLDNVNDLIGD